MDLVKPMLARIVFDRRYADAEFKIGYYDQYEEKVIIVPLYKLFLTPGDRYAVRIVDTNGENHIVPMHHINNVYRNSKLIWHRDNVCILPFSV